MLFDPVWFDPTVSKLRWNRDEPDAPVVLDEIDQGIIRQLQEDGRRTYGGIAEAVGLTEAPARQRVARLIRAGLIEIVAITNPGALGFRLRAAIGLHCDGDLRQIAEALADVDEIDWLVATAGGYDLMAELRCVDEQHLYHLLAKRIRVVPGVRSVETFVYLNLFKASFSWPPGSGRHVPDPAPPPTEARRRPPVQRAVPDGEPVVLDDIDQRIIRELQEDGRRTYGSIAAAVGLTLAPTRQRVARLIDSGVIQIVAIVSPQIAGFQLRAAVGLRCAGDLDTIAAALAEIDEVELVVATAGRVDLIVEVSCRDQRHLYRTLTERIRTVAGVLGAESFVFHHIFKVRYPWPPGLAKGE